MLLLAKPSFNLSVVFVLRHWCFEHHIWNECGCFDGMGPTNLPTWLTCGYTKHSDKFAYLEKYNISHCVNAQNLTSLRECQDIFNKTLQDLLCLKNAKAKFMQDNDVHCDCPPACESTDFETYYSLATWPNDGPELDAAYQELVLGKMIKEFFNNSKPPNFHFEWILNHPWIREKAMSYLTNPDNKREILKDFMRVTVYIKDLTVETTEDVAEYTWDSLLSDIGNFLCAIKHSYDNIIILDWACYVPFYQRYFQKTIVTSQCHNYSTVTSEIVLRSYYHSMHSSS